MKIIELLNENFTKDDAQIMMTFKGYPRVVMKSADVNTLVKDVIDKFDMTQEEDIIQYMENHETIKELVYVAYKKYKKDGSPIKGGVTKNRIQYSFHIFLKSKLLPRIKKYAQGGLVEKLNENKTMQVTVRNLVSFERGGGGVSYAGSDEQIDIKLDNNDIKMLSDLFVSLKKMNGAPLHRMSEGQQYEAVQTIIDYILNDENDYEQHGTEDMIDYFGNEYTHENLKPLRDKRGAYKELIKDISYQTKKGIKKQELTVRGYKPNKIPHAILLQLIIKSAGMTL